MQFPFRRLAGAFLGLALLAAPAGPRNCRSAVAAAVAANLDRPHDVWQHMSYETHDSVSG